MTTTALSRNGEEDPAGSGGQKEWTGDDKESLSSGSLQPPGPRRPLRDESSPGPELGSPLGTLVGHFQGSGHSHSSPPPAAPLGRATRPTLGRGAEPGPAHSRWRLPPPACARRCALWLPPPGRGGERAYPPRRPLRPRSRRRRSVPAGPSFARAPGPGKKGGGPESGRAFPIPHPTGTSLPHITNSFLSHFLAGGGVSWAPPGDGPAPSPEARPRPRQPPAAPRPRPEPRPRPRPWPQRGPAPGPAPPRPLARSGSEPSGSGLLAPRSFQGLGAVVSQE
ncbi:basic proline-rich protein-like [Ovis canadensis]|uniref:basic proline-rich protein-like n=1 Tax=Ovis canadensis TaxID=37174 RepID=UPI00375104BC